MHKLQPIELHPLPPKKAAGMSTYFFWTQSKILKHAANQEHAIPKILKKTPALSRVQKYSALVTAVLVYMCIGAAFMEALAFTPAFLI